jgi:LysR family transcriptional regulator, transcriptional activator of the cysJI operon
MINISWLRTFSTLADTENFTETANKLLMTQPGVSQHVRKLEDDLGQQLIVREGKHFELTPQGKSVLEYARQVLEGEILLKTHINDTDPHRGQCSISSPGGVGTLIYPWLLDTQQQWPDLHIHFVFNPTKEVEQAVKEGECDIGFITHTTNDPELAVEPVSKERLCLILPKEMNYNDFDQLDNIGFIDHPDGKLAAAEVLPKIFTDAEIDVENLNTSGYINHVGMICHPVARGFGYTVLHENIVRLSPVLGQLRIVSPKEHLTHGISVIYKNRWPLHPRYREVIDDLKLRFTEFNRQQDTP